MAPTDDVYESTAQFLAHLCPESVRSQIGVDLSSPEVFACLLRRDHDGYLLKAIEPGKEVEPKVLDRFWEECLRRVRLQGRGQALVSGLRKVPLILENIAHILIKLVNGTAPTPLWTLNADSTRAMPYLKPLDLKSLSEKSASPMMLYHELGGFKNNPMLHGRIQRLFHKGRNTSVFS
ncbi:hypothetical protein H0H92_003434 [Tricholoma furcatifolium]|nr:hypothetical protein H0H92_003434 [Tricholoma furcatifolium]